MTTRALLAATLALFLAPPAPAQPRGADARRPTPLPADGTELFRGLLDFHGVAPVAPQDLRLGDYRELIVVVLGLPPAGPRGIGHPMPHVHMALREGGSVLLAAEEPADLSGYFPHLTGVEITGEQVTGADPARCFGRLANCPFAEPQRSSELDDLLAKLDRKPDPAWGLFGGLEKVATNMPSAVRVWQPSKYVRNTLARFPKGARGEGVPLNPTRVFAVGATASDPNDPPFRSLVLADPSVFTNQMMVAGADPAGGPGTDNLAFSNNVVQWLRGPEKRSRCLFLHHGRPVERFDDVKFRDLDGLPVPPLPPMPPLPSPFDPALQQKLADMGNEALSDLQDRDVPNRAITGGPRNDRRFVEALRFLAVLAALVVFVLLLRRVWNARYEPDLPPTPTDTGRVTGSGPPGSLARRREELLQAGQYTDLVREYLRELFAQQGLDLPVPKPAGKLPPVEVTGPGAATLRDHLRMLWEVAYGPTRRPVTYTRWKELEPMIDAVKRAADDGRWRFAPAGGSA